MEAQAHAPTGSHWEYLDDFVFVSNVWGPIVIPQGFVTDFASVPPILHSIYDDDSPMLLYPSAPHDFLFTRVNGTRGWLSPTQQLSLTEVNHVLVEAMDVCGADATAKAQVFGAVEIANQLHRNEFG